MRILLASHNYSLTGAPLVLLQLARLLDPTEDVTLWSPVGGPLTEDLSIGDVLWAVGGSPGVQGFDLVISNTLLSWPVVLEARSRGVPCLWWLHEGEWARRVLMSEGLAEALALHSEYVVSSKYLVGLYGCEGHVHEIPYGCPVTAPKEWLPGPRHLEFLVAGSIEWRKRQDQVLQAWSRLPYTGARLTLIGDASTDYAKELKRLYRNLAGVTFLDPLPPSEFSKSLGNYDVLLVPSRDEGGYPQVLLQAQEKGLCVVASDVCGMKEQVAPGTGFITNAWESVFAVLPKADRVNHIQRMGEQARSWAHHNNSLQAHLDAWTQLIKETCGRTM